MFASSSRLDLSICVGPQKPSHIKTILSSPLPIFIEYNKYLHEDITGSATWRMHAALRHRDRVREISFGRSEVIDLVIFGKFIKATNYHFPALESLVLYFPYGYKPALPATFLRGPDQSDLRLRRLILYDAPLASVSGLLLSARALTDLTLNFASIAATFDSSQGSFLLACLQGMQRLRSLDIITPYKPRDSQSQHSTPKDIFPLLNLTRFHYSGPTAFLNNFMSGLSAPSLQDVRFVLRTRYPLLYLPRVIDDVSEEFRSVSVTFNTEYFRLLSSANSGEVDRHKPSFRFNVNCSPGSIQPIINTPSTKLAMVEELALFFPSSDIANWEDVFSLRGFLRQFHNVRVLRVDPFIREVALSLQQDDGEDLLSLLEEIELSALPISRSTKGPDEEYQHRAAAELAAFEPFISAREQTGRPVNVFHREMPRSG